MKVSVIIPVYNKYELTRQCLQTLAGSNVNTELEVIVVDNASTDSTVQLLPALGQELWGERFFYLRQSENINFGPACNCGAKQASGDFIFFLNNDTIVQEGWLEPLLAAFEQHPKLAGVGATLLYPECYGRKDRVQHIGIGFWPQLYAAHPYEFFPATHPACLKPRYMQALTAAALLMPRALFIEQGGFDPRFINGGEDIELGLRLSALGYRFTCVSSAKIYHFVSQSAGRHAYEAHNAALLKETSLTKIMPDMQRIAEQDGYVLRLNSLLQPYFDLPERRKPLFERQLARCSSAEELLALLEREPLLHAGYIKLAELQLAGAQHESAAHTLALGLKLFPNLTLAKLLLTHSNSNAFEHAGYAEAAKGCITAHAQASQEELRATANFMQDFTAKAGLTELSAEYAAFLAL